MIQVRNRLRNLPIDNSDPSDQCFLAGKKIGFNSLDPISQHLANVNTHAIRFEEGLASMIVEIETSLLRSRVLESANILPSSSRMQFTPEGSSTIDWVFSKNGCRL